MNGSLVIISEILKLSGEEAHQKSFLDTHVECEYRSLNVTYIFEINNYLHKCKIIHASKFVLINRNGNKQKQQQKGKMKEKREENVKERKRKK